jgi:hypothetical protein
MCFVRLRHYPSLEQKRDAKCHFGQHTKHPEKASLQYNATLALRLAMITALQSAELYETMLVSKKEYPTMQRKREVLQYLCYAFPVCGYSTPQAAADSSSSSEPKSSNSVKPATFSSAFPSGAYPCTGGSSFLRAFLAVHCPLLEQVGWHLFFTIITCFVSPRAVCRLSTMSRTCRF